MKAIILLSLLVQALSVNCQMTFGYLNYTEYYAGNINILISVPHDGGLQPDGITTRTSDDLGNLARDTNTKKIALVLRDTLTSLFQADGKTAVPFMVANNLHRQKMDPNRDISDCCAKIGEDSLITFNEYHSIIRNKFELEHLALNKYKQALLVDIHGQRHQEAWTELGFLLTKDQINSLKKPLRPEASSVCSMSRASSYSFEEIIRGPVSLGALLMNNYAGLNVVPSPDVPRPNDGKYYNGGYITTAHGSKGCSGSIVNAIQIESPATVRSDDEYTGYAKALALSLYQFYNIHNFGELKSD